jgi:hypothetical protein
MDSPIMAMSPIFAGAIKRVNNPHSIRFQPSALIRGLLAEHDIIGAGNAKFVQQVFVGLGITLVTKIPLIEFATNPDTQLQQ